MNCVSFKDMTTTSQLTDEGREQALERGNSLRELGIERIIASDLARAYETATIIGHVLGLGVETNTLLRERCFGVFEGKPFAELTSVDTGIIDRVMVNPDATPSGGESFNDVVERARQFIVGLDDSWRTQRLLVVTHGGTIHALRAYANGDDTENLEWYSVGNCSEWTITPFV